MNENELTEAGEGADTSDESAPTRAEAAGDLDKENLKEEIVKVLKDVYDPEIPVDIYELGLIYDIEVADDAAVTVRMTLTSPSCPAAGSLPPEVEYRTGKVEGVSSAQVLVVWEPPWTPDLMSEVARVELNMW